MQFAEIERIFNRALIHSFSKKKLLIVFPVLILCGLLVVFGRALSIEASPWVILSLTFLPVFLGFGILLAAGVFLVRIYSHELRGHVQSYRSILKSSWDLLIGVTYLSLPLILAYLILWMVLGVFYLLREIPGVGETIGVFLSFGPFLLVLGSLCLSIINLFFLFFATPHIALKEGMKLHVLDRVLSNLKEHVFSSLILFFLGLIPLLLFLGIMSLAATMTGANYLASQKTLAVAFEWFFIMVPFCALLAPVVVFFFNFSAESYALFERRKA